MIKIEETKAIIDALPAGEEYAGRWSGDYADFDGDGLKTLAQSHTALLSAAKEFASASQSEDIDLMAKTFNKLTTAIAEAER